MSLFTKDNKSNEIQVNNILLKYKIDLRYMYNSAAYFYFPNVASRRREKRGCTLSYIQRSGHPNK